MTKLSLTLRYHWKAALGWSLTLLVGAGYALWYSLAPVAQAQGLSQGKPSMVACTVILLQAKDDQCLEIMAPTPDRAVVVCGDGAVDDFCQCENVNICLDAIDTYGWGNLGVFADLIPRGTP